MYTIIFCISSATIIFDSFKNTILQLNHVEHDLIRKNQLNTADLVN